MPYSKVAGKKANGYGRSDRRKVSNDKVSVSELAETPDFSSGVMEFGFILCSEIHSKMGYVPRSLWV